MRIGRIKRNLKIIYSAVLELVPYRAVNTTSVMGGDKSVTQPTSRCCRTESIVSLERGVCSCAELQVFSCYRG